MMSATRLNFSHAVGKMNNDKTKEKIGKKLLFRAVAIRLVQTGKCAKYIRKKSERVFSGQSDLKN